LDYGALAEKPKVRELQMDWLRSEDLKEEKSVTTSVMIIAGETLLPRNALVAALLRLRANRRRREL
jgi:hypothetical protein